MAGDAKQEDKLREGEFAPGTRIGRYRLDEIVGRGGMGTVYRAFDAETQREVAIKVLLPGLPESLRERFLAECEAEAKIRHAHVMPVYDRGTFEGDRPYFVMELVYEPITLGDVVETNQKGALGKTWPRLRQWRSPARLAADVLVPIADGVDAANREYGFLHRDLKPDNILIDVRTRRPYLIDFGICHAKGQPTEEAKIVGTPRFLSPEQARAKLTPRTDVFGLGALLRFLFTGAPPIRESSPLRRQERDQRVQELLQAEAKARSTGRKARAKELAARRETLETPDFRTLDDMLDDAREGRYPPLPESMPAPARAICEKAMAKDPAERYESAAAFAEDLRAWTEGGSVKAQEERDATGAAVLAAQRTVRRYLVPAALCVLGLALGIALGISFLSGPAETTVERFRVAADEVDELHAAFDALDNDRLTPIELGLRHRWLRNRVALAKARATSLPDGPHRERVLAALATAEGRLASAPLLLEIAEGARPARLIARRMGDNETISLSPGRNDLPPGLYRLEIEGASWLRVPFELPWRPDGRENDPVRLLLTLPADRPPAGMVYVPGTAKGEDPFWITGREITYLEYADFLDALPDNERRARLPKTGFAPDRSHPGTFLLATGFETRAVTGLRQADVRAFALWRRELYDRADRLPTAREWERAAGIDWMKPSAARLFSTKRDASPFGVLDLGTPPAELVLSADAVLVKGRGFARSRDAIREEEPAAPEARLDAGFRLVVPIG